MAKKDINTIRRDNKINKDKPDNSVKWVVWLFLVLVFLVWSFQYGKSTFSTIFLSLGQHNQIIKIQQTPVEQAISHISLTSSFKIVEINSDKNLYMNIQLSNQHDKPIKDFEIQCISDFKTPHMQKLKVTILQTIEPSATLTLVDYNFGSINDNPQSINCSVTDLVLN